MRFKVRASPASCHDPNPKGPTNQTFHAGGSGEANRSSTKMFLGKTLLRWLTTGALPVAAAATARRAAPSSSAVAILPEVASSSAILPRRIVLEELSTCAAIFPRGIMFNASAFSAVLPRRIIIDSLTAAPPSATFQRLNHRLNSTSLSASLSRWVLEEFNGRALSGNLSRRSNLNAAAVSATLLRRIIFEERHAAEAFSTLAEINAAAGSLSAAVGRETVRRSPSSMSSSSDLDMLPEETLFDVVLHASRVSRVAASTLVFLLRPLQHGAATSSARVWAPCGTHGARRLSSSASPSPPGSSFHRATATALGPGCSADSSPPTDSSSQSQAQQQQLIDEEIAQDDSSPKIDSSSRQQQQLIDETTPEDFNDAETYLKSHPLLIQVKVSGSGALFWRLSDDAGYLIRPISQILKKYHAIGYYLSGPLSVSNILVSKSGKVKLRNVKFVKKESSLEHLNQDYSYLAQLIKKMMIISNGGRSLKKIPIDFKDYINFLEGNDLKEKDEFLIANHSSLLPMSNRGYVFLMFYDHIVHLLGRKNSNLSSEIIDKMIYERTWIKTAFKNKKLRKWLAHKWYNRTNKEMLDFIRNVLSHRYKHTDNEIEETLYCEWPQLLLDMQKELH